MGGGLRDWEVGIRFLSRLPLLSIDQRPVRRSLGCGLSWGPPASRVKNRGCPEPRQVQTNMPSPRPHPGLALEDATGLWADSGFPQQSNVGPPGARRPRQKARVPTEQQSNLGLGGTASPRLQDGLGQRAPPSLRAGRAPPGPAPSVSVLRPSMGSVRPGGHTGLDDGTWHGPESRVPALLGEPLTLEDLAVPAHSQAGTPPPTALRQLLATVQQLEHRAVSLRCQAAWKLPDPAQQGPDSRRSLPTCPQPCQPGLTSLHEKKWARGPRGTARVSEMPAAQARLPGCPVHTPGSPKTALGMAPHGFLGSEQGPGWKCPQWPASSGRHRAPPSLPAPTGGVLCEWEGEKAQGLLTGRKEERPASSPPNPALARRRTQQSQAQSIVVQKLQAASRQPLAAHFRAWRCWARRRQALARAVALSRRRLLRRGLQALRWTLWIREAQLEVAWGRHTRALLARSFQEWRRLALRQSPSQAASGPPTSRRSWSQGPGPALGGKAMEDPAWRNSPGERQPAEGWPETRWRRPKRPGLAGLHHLAAFLLWCYQQDRARREKGTLGEAPGATPRTQRTGGSPRASEVPAAPAPQTAWLRRCFGAWRQVPWRRARCQEHLASRRLRTLGLCLKQWVRMQQLRASDGAKVTQLALRWRRAGSMAGGDSASGPSSALGLGPVAQAQPWKQGSLREACRSLALRRTLLLWRTRLCQHRQATCFSQGVQHRLLRGVLSWWRWRARGRDTGWVPEPWGRPGEGAWLGCSPPQGALDEVQAQRSRSRGAVIRCQPALHRRVSRGWSHWMAAQGAWRELAARQAWDCGCRAALGPWRPWLAPWQEAERRNQGRAWAALHHCRSCWQRRRFLQERRQRWGRVHAQIPRRPQAAAGGRHLKRAPEASAQDHVQPPAIVWRQGPGAGPMHWPRLASRGRLLPLDTPGPWKQTHGDGARATGPARAWPTRQPGCAGQRPPRDRSWAEREDTVSPAHFLSHLPAAFQHFPDPLLSLWAAAAWSLERQEGQAGEAERLHRWVSFPGDGELPLGPASPGHGRTAPEQPPSGPGRLSDSETRAGLGRKALRRWRLVTLLHRFQASRRARCLARTWQCWADATGVEQLSRALLRQWHLGQAWRTWRRSAVRLRMAQRLRREEERRVLSQAFQKWHQRVTARSPREEPAASPPSPGGRRELPRPPAVVHAR
ncbi:LOW QUALITY PROTEIN: uncharacterized protein C1orf167 homolog [Perognathus longimembris pacificus]|uniref:LOW QUALITY PROTEIN: uncharacterized protein C1orf167 homolog n=1 Tax=Perognathus longimembris pacificus TaxID=214514 RepID=UPI0020191971|nr:LOW QUALITY PROTEIN: uncharacterized protein C1orf167 homolog [Perognathus longimembris pacificus]